MRACTNRRFGPNLRQRRRGFCLRRVIGRVTATIESSGRKDFSLNDRYRHPTRIVALWLGLMACIGQAQAQFGATGSSDLPLWLVLGPWVVLLLVLPVVWWLRPAWRPRLCTAVRRGVIAYLLIEFVPVVVCMLVIALFDVGRNAGLMFWVMSLMGVIFSGLVLLTFILVALALDWVVGCWRRARADRTPSELAP